MSSSKPCYIALCLLCTALPARAGQPNDTRSTDSSQKADSGYIKEWGGKTFEEWCRDIRFNPDPSYRAAALMAIPYFGQRAADAIPDILTRLSGAETDASPRVKAAMLLRMIPHHETDRPRIIRALAHTIGYDVQSIIRYEAAVSLRNVFCPFHFEVKEESDAIKDLIRGLETSRSTYELREIVIEILMKAGVDPKTGPDPRVTDRLMEHADFVKEPTTQVRLNAIVALATQGRPHDPKKLTEVIKVLKQPTNYQSKHPTVKIWSHVALIALEEKLNPTYLKTIAGYLTDREAAVRQQAVRALGALGEKAEGYVDNILKMLEREQVPAVRAEAAIALGNMKNTGSRVIAALTKLSEEDERETIGVTISACWGFVLLGNNNAEVMRAMDKVLEHKSLDKGQKAYVKKLIDELQNPGKKPVRSTAKEPEKAVAPAGSAKQQKVNMRR